VLTVDELEGALAAGYEGRGFEFKGSGASDDRRFLAKIARAAISMGNLRDGGHVVIGIDDTRPQDMVPGLDGPELASWLAYDAVSARLAEYCDPPLRFEVAQFQLSSGAQVAVLHVHEFSDVPDLCARDYPDVLRKGALYVRARRMPETAEVASSTEMREILDLAAEKRLRVYVETAERAGVLLAASESRAADKDGLEDQARFEAQRREVWE
jgi:predicted HTH transcriptional regulator